jgi:protein TonB
MIWIPEPKTEAPKPLPLPNVVAVAPPPKLVRPFTAPESPRPERAAPQLPDAPRVAAAVEAESLPFAAPTPRLQPRAFTPPPEAPRPQAAPAALPAAPEIAVSAPAEASLVIAGLDPAKTMEVPAPPGSRQAGFSAAPQPRPRGGDDGGRQGALLVVPGLLARGGAKEDQPTLAAEAAPTSRRNLLVAARSAPGPLPPVSTEPRATRVASAPDPRLEGRVIYTVAIQMPNVTSYTGSWIVWFAEREPGPGAALESPPPDMRPPLPLRKVDPKYIAAAASERVEGKVRLAAVIRRNGRVEAVTLLRHLDDRLDRSAEEALAKWEFEPALRNGSAVDVDAVFEIPFRLAPKPAK